MPPWEPPPTPWALPDPRAAAAGDDLIGVGADLEPGTLLAAYRSGLFPMPTGRAPFIRSEGPLGLRASRSGGAARAVGWWSPDPRGIIPLDDLRITRSLQRSVRRYEIRVDGAFDAVVDGCGDPKRPHGWISPGIHAAYLRLHQLGWAHSVETWLGGHLVGGLYGVAVGGLFAGESMFHRAPDASKVALVALVDHLTAAGPKGRLLDVQWLTPHLASLGAVEIARAVYLDRLEVAIGLDDAFSD